MKHVSLNKLYSSAVAYHGLHQPWHFHILTPDCRLNNSTQYALILENTQTQEILINYAETPYQDIGKQLMELLHGPTVINHNQKMLPPPSQSAAVIITRAKELSHVGIHWHHHLLFPECQYNTHPGKYTLIFEDPQSRETLESVTSAEPTNDLKHLEPLFYQQKQ